ncbi:MAG TPA: hypothetical protein VIL11_00920, partial [Limnochordales bacterium]
MGSTPRTSCAWDALAGRQLTRVPPPSYECLLAAGRVGGGRAGNVESCGYRAARRRRSGTVRPADGDEEAWAVAQEAAFWDRETLVGTVEKNATERIA